MTNDHEYDAAITRLSNLFHHRMSIDVPRPQVQCIYCTNGHPTEECPFTIVSQEMLRNYDNRQHPTKLYLRSLYLDFCPLRCMICESNHHTCDCPNDYRRCIQHGHINGSRTTRYRYRSYDQMNMGTYSPTSSGHVDMYSEHTSDWSGHASGWSDTLFDEDEDANITANPLHPMPSTPPLVEESPVTNAPTSVGRQLDELQFITAEKYGGTQPSDMNE
jgi:hypothetical protein